MNAGYNDRARDDDRAEGTLTDQGVITDQKSLVAWLHIL